MDAGVASSLAVAIVSLLLGLLTFKNNRAGQSATNAIEGKKVDLEEFREMQDRMDKALERADKNQEKSDTRMAQLERDLAAERAARLTSDARAEAAEARAERAEQRVDRIAAAVAAHGQWDLLVLAEVRKSNSDFPDPPPLALLDS